MNMEDSRRGNDGWGSSEVPDAYKEEWPIGYFDRCDELMQQARVCQPTANICVLENGNFEVRFQEKNKVYAGLPGADRVEALTLFIDYQGIPVRQICEKPVAEDRKEIQLSSLRKASSMSSTNWVQ